MTLKTLCACALVCVAGTLVAQRPTDSAAQASPIQPAPRAAATDSAAEASPELGPKVGSGAALVRSQAVHVKLERGVDSGRVKNGDTVPATLTAPVRLTTGASLPAGTPVAITVVEAVPAGRLSAAGELSLQVVRVGRVATATDFRVYRGQPGPREVADAAPKIGTDAGLPAGAELEFHVLNPDAPAESAPKQTAKAPGSVDGTASGSAPPASARSNAGEPVFGDTGKNQVNGKASTVQPADTTMGAAQHTGQAGSPPNQPSAPSTAQPGSTTQPH